MSAFIDFTFFSVPVPFPPISPHFFQIETSNPISVGRLPPSDIKAGILLFYYNLLINNKFYIIF